MHHLYPSLKGDQLCPLGFHPQTRYPTRCKRCFRDYKEHGARRGVEDLAVSSPNLTDAQNASPSKRSWTSTQNLSTATGNNSSTEMVVHFNVELKKRPLSWASTPDFDDSKEKSSSSSDAKTTKPADENNVQLTLKLPLPPRRHTTILDIKEVENSLEKISNSSKVSSSPSHKSTPEELIILSTDSLAERVRKMNLLKKQRSINSRESSRERSIPKNEENIEEIDTNKLPDRPQRSKSGSMIDERKKSSLPPKKITIPKITTTPCESSVMQSEGSKFEVKNTPETVSTNRRIPSENKNISNDLKSKDIKIFNKNKEDIKPINDSRVDASNEVALKDEIKSLRAELELTKLRMERAERDKSDILLRRLASMETAPNRTAASEAIMLQQKVNELKGQLETVNEEKRRLNLRMKELENSPHNLENELKRKLNAAEQICEELMEENQASKREIINLQAEMDELQDSFREDDVKTKTSLQKDLEKATKNCRILSFKLKKSERKIEILEQERQSTYNSDLIMKVRKLEEELRFSTDLTRKLQMEAEDLRNPGKKKTPTLGALGKSTSADAKITRESLTRGGSQEDPQQLLRDLQDSVERESDLKDQLKFSEEEADSLRKKVARFEDENESLMMQLKKMATRSRSRKLSPTPAGNHFSIEAQAERDEGISDEDDPAELRILLELNEQEASILRIKVDDLEKQNNEARTQIRDLQEKLLKNSSKNAPGRPFDKQVKSLNEEILQLKKEQFEKDQTIDRLREEIKFKTSENGIELKRRGELMEQEIQLMKTKIKTLERENGGLKKDLKIFQTEMDLKKNLISEFEKLKEENKALSQKLKKLYTDADQKLPPRSPKHITDLTPKNHLKKWVEELEEEINDMRLLVLNSGSEKIKQMEIEKKVLEDDLIKTKRKLALADGDIQRLKTLTNSTSKVTELELSMKKAVDENKKAANKIKDLEEKAKIQESLLKQTEAQKATAELHAKRAKDKLDTLQKDFEKEHLEREKLESEVAQLKKELSNTQKVAEKIKSSLQKDIKELQNKATNPNTEFTQVSDLNNKISELQKQLTDENKRYGELNIQWEKMSEEMVLMRAQLTTEKENLLIEMNSLKQKLASMEAIRIERTEFAKKLNEAQKKIMDLQAKSVKEGYSDQEKQMLKNKLSEKEHEYERLKRENEMNIDLVCQLRRETDDLSSKLSDFNRIDQAQSSLNGHNANLDAELKSVKNKLQNTELQLKAEVASTRLRYEQQMKNLSAELTAMQRQCERFKKDRDAFKQMLELSQKKIGELKANTTGRQSRTSMHSSDEDDKGKIAYLEQQVGCLEDQLVEARLEVSKFKTELVSERSANEIKISEMQSKLNELEEERVIGSGRTKIPGMKTKLELSWQKEREDQQRLLQETSTLARDLRQTLFEVERERDKERLESKRRLDQIKRSTEEESEEGRKKIAELQCDLLELRDVHAKLRTSNEKLRRERERYEKELIKRRMENDGGESKVCALLHTVDELVKIAPYLQTAYLQFINKTPKTEQSSIQRDRSPAPNLSTADISSILSRLSETSEELRKLQRVNEDEQNRIKLRRGNLRRATSQENDPHGSTSSVASISGPVRNNLRLSRNSANNGSLIRKSLSLDHSMQKDQTIWRQDDGSLSSMQSIDSQMTGLDSNLDSRLSGGSTQSDIPRGPRKKKKSLMGKLRSFTKSTRNSESEISIQGSDSDISVASDMRSSKKDLRGRLSGMFKRSSSAARSESTERQESSEQRPVAVTIVGDLDGPERKDPLPANALTVKPIRSVSKPPAGTPTTPLTKRRLAK